MPAFQGLREAPLELPAVDQSRQRIVRGLVGDPAREAAVLSELSMLLVSTGRNAEAEAASRRAIELVTPMPDGPETWTACGFVAPQSSSTWRTVTPNGYS